MNFVIIQDGPKNRHEDIYIFIWKYIILFQITGTIDRSPPKFL